MTRATAMVAMVGMWAMTAVPTFAQGRFELSGGAAFTGGIDFGRQDATLTSNTTTGGTTLLFRTENALGNALGAQGRLGITLTSSLAVEAGFRFSRPVYRIRATNDFENAEDVNIEETLNDYLFDGSAVWYFGDASSARALPFIFGGAGYFRSLHEGASSVEDGLEYHVGGGVKWWFGSGASQFGLRADAGVSIRGRELDVDSGSRVVPTATGSLVWRF